MNQLASKLDLLADGELSGEEYRSLLGSLDHEPSGWKQCALALLEHQALKRDLGGWTTEAMQKSSAVAQPLVKPAQQESDVWKSSRAWWGTMTGIAASLVLTFLLGRGSVTSPEVGSPTQLAQPSAADTQHGRVTLVMNGPNGEPREVELPVISGHGVDARELLDHPVVIPPDVKAAFEAAGHRVESERRLVPVKLDDQRSVVVPIDRVRVVPKSRPTY